MLTITQFAALHKVTRQYIHLLLKEGRLPSARKVGCYWVLPNNAKILDKRKRRR